MAKRPFIRHLKQVERTKGKPKNPGATVYQGNWISHGSVERRRTPRISVPFPVRVRGISATGERLQFDTALDNLCARGLYLQTRQKIQTWERLVVIMRLSLESDMALRAPVVAARSTVLRTDLQSNDGFGFAIGFTRYHFI